MWERHRTKEIQILSWFWESPGPSSLSPGHVFSPMLLSLPLAACPIWALSCTSDIHSLGASAIAITSTICASVQEPETHHPLAALPQPLFIAVSP